MKKTGFNIEIKDNDEWLDGKLYFLDLGIEVITKEKSVVLPFSDMNSVTRERGNTVIKYTVKTDLTKEIKELIFKMDDSEHNKIVIEYQKNKVPVEPLITYDKYLEKQKEQIKKEMSSESKMLIFRFILIIIAITSISLTFLIPVDGSNNSLKLYIIQACIALVCLIVFILSFKISKE
jgi:hypothetical protein